jgi:hypothetical protein
MNASAPYCRGGIADGFHQFSSAPETFTTVILYCSGGRSDGFHLSPGKFSSFNTQGFYSSGGIADGSICSPGFTKGMPARIFHCYGGKGDGHSLHPASASLSPILICGGGKGDGFCQDLLSGEIVRSSYLCSGGKSDGFYSSAAWTQEFGSGFWTGVFSDSWFQISNWANRQVPGENTAVVIPPCCQYYPSLHGVLAINSAKGLYRCKSLEIRTGAGFATSDTLCLHGMMKVGGEFISTNNLNHSQLISAGGALTITVTGIMKLGNQSTSSGICDLIIEPGGKLDIQGGILEIDDQFNIQNGGIFLMNGGNLFTHRYGNGSQYNTYNPGAFYAAQGASGQVSGGIVDICGRTTNGSFTAFQIAGENLDFTGTSTLCIKRGVSSLNENADLKLVPGADLANLAIDKPYTVASLATDATVNGSITIYPLSTLKINPGVTVIVRDSVIIGK